jgi:hypothetical protein
MDGQQPISFVLPRPGRALKLLLIAIFGLGVFNAAARWIPHGEQVFLWLACDLDKVLHGQIWRLVTSGLLTSPAHYGHLLFTIMGLYFLTPDLERRWGSRASRQPGCDARELVGAGRDRSPVFSAPRVRRVLRHRCDSRRMVSRQRGRDCAHDVRPTDAR